MGFKDLMNTVKSEAGDAVDVTKLKGQISKERTGIKDNYQKIGEIIYNRYADGCDDAELADMIKEITEAKERIRKNNEEIDRIKMN
jgi:predicted  nucleic acid-binding Zn-ribbon protein